VGLTLVTACTKPNPAYWFTVATADGGGAGNPPMTMPDAAPVPPDGPAPIAEDGPSRAADSAGQDATLSPDAGADGPSVAPDLAALMPDVALPRDLSPPPPDLAGDLAPALNPDSGVSTVALVAHWKLDEGGGSTVNDATPNASHGSTRNGATLVAGGFPRARFPNPGSLRLDGQDDYVEINNVKNIPGSSISKSVTAWFKATNPDGIPIRNLVALTNESADWGVQLGLDQGRVAAWFFGDLGPQIWQQSGKVDTEWHHAAYTFDGKSHRIYYDGQLEMTKDVPPPMNNIGITRTRLGTWKAPEEMFHGLIDDVRIYARKLDDAEVMVLYNGY